MQQAQKSKDKVSSRQLGMLYIISGFSSSIRFLPSFAAQAAKEAGWASPIMAVIPLGLNIFFLHRIFSKSKDKSAFTVITEILGKYAGKLAIFLHLLWVLLLLGFFIRFHGERLVNTVFPNIDITFFMVITLIIISYVLRSGAAAVARMGEFLAPVLLLLFIFVSAFLLPNIRVNAILPVYFNDIIPMFKAGLGTLSLFSYALIMFFVSPQITSKENTAKIMIRAGSVYFTLLVVLLLMCIGLLGSPVAAKSSNAFLMVVKQISILDTIENIESLVIAMWLLSDAMAIVVMAIAALNIMKFLFMLSDQRNLINILLIFMYLFSVGIAVNRLELDLFSNAILLYINIAFGYGTPALLYFVGRLRKKI